MFTIKIDNLWIEGASLLLADNINITLNKGEILWILWPTGAGKTSLLRLIAWFSVANNFFYKADISYEKVSYESKEYKKNISFSFQEAEDQFLLNTVKNEVYLPLGQKQCILADKLFKHFNLEEKKDSLIRDLSTWEKKTISIISTLSLDRDIVILDEPTANMDPDQVKNFLSYIESIRKNKIIIISSHEQSLESIYDKILFFDNNRWILLSSIEYNKRKKSNLFIDNLSIEETNDDEIIFENISFHHLNSQEIFKNMSLNIKKWDIMLISWNNGSWKTTLINLITWKLKPSIGKITRKYKRLWIIFQEPEKQLFGDTIESEIYFDEIEKKNVKYIQDRLWIFWLIKDESFHPYFLSRWQKQALLILAVIHKSPDLLIIDEPFTWLDNDLTEKIFNLINDYHKKSRCTIIFTHQNTQHFDINGIKVFEI